MKFAAFDIEIAKILPEGEIDWQAERPLGISCAAITLSPEMLHFGDYDGVACWYGLTNGFPYDGSGGDYRTRIHGRMDRRECAGLVRNMLSLAQVDGYTFVTVNGLGFDFQILAEESGMWRECADLALNYHCDLMMMTVCAKGWRTGLDSLAKGAEIESKLKSVALKDGSVLHGMNGAMAPQMWADGEYDAVLAYLRQDVVATMGVAQTAVARQALRWVSSKGREWRIGIPDGRLPTCAEMLQWQRPDTSWMTDPPNPAEIAGWALDWGV